MVSDNMHEKNICCKMVSDKMHENIHLLKMDSDKMSEIHWFCPAKVLFVGFGWKKWTRAVAAKTTVLHIPMSPKIKK